MFLLDGEQIGFPVADVHQSRIRQLLFYFTDTLIAFQLAFTFLRLMTIARPHPGIGGAQRQAQRQALRRHHQGRVKVQPRRAS